MLREGEVSTMAGSRYVLAEFSESSEGSYIRERDVYKRQVSMQWQ